MKSTRRDLELLTKVLPYEDLSRGAREAFERWQEELQTGKRRLLTDKQRTWAFDELDRREPQALNLWSKGKVPVGKPVPLPDVLQPHNRFAHPLKPPKRPSTP